MLLQHIRFLLPKSDPSAGFTLSKPGIQNMFPASPK